MMKRFLLLFTVGALLCAPAHGPAHADVGDVSVGGVAVTKENASDVCGDGTVSFDFETRTLTLHNAVLTDCTPDGHGDGDAIFSEGDLTLRLICENRIETDAAVIEKEKYKRYGNVCCGGNLTITAEGAGSLTLHNAMISADEIHFVGGNIVSFDDMPRSRIHAFLLQGELTVTGGSYEGFVEGNGSAFANWNGASPVFPDGTVFFEGDAAPGEYTAFPSNTAERKDEWTSTAYLKFICPNAVRTEPTPAPTPTPTPVQEEPPSPAPADTAAPRPSPAATQSPVPAETDDARTGVSPLPLFVAGVALGAFGALRLRKKRPRR